MGRPRLYHTDQEKEDARNAKSKRSYDNTPVVQQTTSSEGSHNGGVTTTEHAINLWMEHAESVDKQLTTITGDSPSRYLNTMCLDFLANYDKDPIHEQTIKLSKLQKVIYKYWNEIYALDGVGETYGKVDKIVKHICMVVSWVEELLCYAMVDVEEVKTRYEKHQFFYQVE
ncbi:hypothetical protein BYT27DRAFT_7219066 [Phlegmacium glaucopus]|nr:hypothetical protein BYT27DRAFT_7219066 [Phlegmacium glaucopus]